MTHLSPTDWAAHILQGNTRWLAQAITLAESTKPSDRTKFFDLLTLLQPHTGKSIRVAITGAPGAGKSTFIEAWGLALVAAKKKVAVLAVDPSSERSGGSILGDKSRMEKLSVSPQAFIRPSAAGWATGGVHAHTREAILLCEAAGFDFIIIETIGAGQNEVAARQMSDFFLLLQSPHSGDDLQGIKRGVMEFVDGIFVTKADGDSEQAAQHTQHFLQQALSVFRPSESGWMPEVIAGSSVTRLNLDKVTSLVERYVQHTKQTHFFDEQRKQQQVQWFREQWRRDVWHTFFSMENEKTIAGYEQQIIEQQLVPPIAAQAVVQHVLKKIIPK